MRQTISMVLCSMIIASCSTSGLRDSTTQLDPNDKTTWPADQMAAYAIAKQNPRDIILTMDAVEKLIPQDPSYAKSILDAFNYDQLPDSELNLKERLALLQARIADQLGQSQEVFDWLDRPAVIKSINPKTIALAHTLKAKAYNLFSEYSAALDEWIIAIPLLADENQINYQDDFWQTLLHTPEKRLTLLINQNLDTVLHGWLTLAQLYQPGRTLDAQLQGLKRWTLEWPQHPGNAYLPKDFVQIENKAFNPKKIAVLLPLSGSLERAGNAIRDGIIAARYYHLNKKEQVPELVFVNTDDQDINEIAKTAIQEGAEMIIGPLSKNQVNSLTKEITTQVPVLALNYLDSPSSFFSSPSLYQIGLSTENEVQTIAARAMLDGHTRALMLTPKTNWGEKAMNAFTQNWEKKEGEIAAAAAFDKQPQFSNLIGQLLHIDESNARAKKINRLIGKKVNFNPRRRQDIDMIFIAASPSEARQIKPALSYQYAGSIPVYATSSIYTGQANKSRDRDLDNIRIPVMPWSLPNTTSPLRRTITAEAPQARGSYGTLYALGADVYALHPILEQLQKLPGSQILGLTGWLRINEDLRVERELTWQIFKNGTLRPLPAKYAKNR